MKIAIINPGGITNFGERAIMLGTVYQLRSQYPDADISIFGYEDLATEDPRLYEELHNFGVKFLAPVIRGTKKYARITHAFGLLLSPNLFMEKNSYDYLKDAKVFSKGQESFTQDYGITHFIDSFLEQLIISRFNRDVTLLGHSIGPIYKYRKISTYILNRFASIQVRDSRSKKLLLDLGYDKSKIKQIKDLAYAAVAKYDLGKKPKRSPYYLIVPNAAICRNDLETEQYLNNLKTVIVSLIKRKEHIRIGSSVTSNDWNNDYKLCEELKSQFKELELVHYTQLHEFLIDVKGAQKVISSRLHPLIMATGLGTAVFALSKSHKVKGLLGDLNMSDEIVDPFISLNNSKLLLKI